MFLVVATLLLAGPVAPVAPVDGIGSGRYLKNVCAAGARYAEGKKVADVCTASECLHFVMGYLDGAHAMTSRGADLPWCEERGVTLGQKILIVSKYLEAHPEELHHSGPTLINSAMEAAFPCFKPQKQP